MNLLYLVLIQLCDLENGAEPSERVQDLHSIAPKGVSQDHDAAAHDLTAAGERGMALDAARVEIKSVSDALEAEEFIASGRIAVDSIVAVIGKTEGNGGTKCVSPWGPR